MRRFHSYCIDFLEKRVIFRHVNVGGHMRQKAAVRGRRIRSRVREQGGGYHQWCHAGGKLHDLGPKALATEELLAILISTGYKGKSAGDIANDVLRRYGSLEALSNVPLADLLEVKGLGDVKIIRIAATLELARRTTQELLRKHARSTRTVRTPAQV